jgi:hypothetical protein
MRLRYVAVLSLLFTAAFFIEYTPLWPRVHIPYDLEYFHYPLADYAFQAIRDGRFPQWDPTIYCGLSFAGNVQAALFYPPTWVMFTVALALGHLTLSYQALEDLVLAHVWLAFLLCYLWLYRGRRLHWLASALGSGIFAFSGYMLLQLQHLGLICGYAWMPLGFFAIDEADDSRRWQPLWKLALASAMCFLAGYPTGWVVFAVCMIVYAGARKESVKYTFWTACALAGSMLFAAVQLLPAWEATRLRVPEVRYGSVSGMRDPGFYLSYLVPNFFDFGLHVDPHTNPGKDYLYLGASAFVGIALFLGRRRYLGASPLIAVLLVSFVCLANPFGLVGRAVSIWFLLSQLFNAWYFLPGITAAIAGLAAIGLDWGLTHTHRPIPAWKTLVVTGLAFVWSVRLAIAWAGGGRGFSTGWRSGIDALIAATLIGALTVVFAAASGRLRICVSLSLLLLVAVEYKAFGTSKRFNASAGRSGASFAHEGLTGMNSATYGSLQRRIEYRLAMDLTGPPPTTLRHTGLATPQGFDPLLPAHYQAFIERVGHFRSDREFDLPPENESALQLLGVGYFITSEQAPLYSRLLASPHFHLLQSEDSYYKVFELLDARPSFGWEEPDAGDVVEVSGWQPEWRAFRVQSRTDGAFRLTEQFHPGWSASVDGAPATVQRCHEAFQCVAVPPGEHRLEFRYREPWLIPGAIISLAAVLLAVAVLVR